MIEEDEKYNLIVEITKKKKNEPGFDMIKSNVKMKIKKINGVNMYYLLLVAILLKTITSVTFVVLDRLTLM